jgi:hypothetical protein
MTTYGIMQTRIADEIVRDDLASQVRNAIQDAIKQWEGRRFFFNEKRYKINTVAGQEYYDLIPSTLLLYDGSALSTGEMLLEADDVLAVVNTSMPYKLTPRTDLWIEENQSGTYRGQPASWGIYGNQLRLYPIPDAIYATYPRGLGRLATLSADSDTNNWMTEGEVLIRNQAKLILYRDLVRDPDGKALAEQALAEAEWALSRKTSAKTMTGQQAAWTL